MTSEFARARHFFSAFICLLAITLMRPTDSAASARAMSDLRPPAPALLNGVGKRLEIADLSEATTAFDRPFPDPVEVTLRSAAGPSSSTPPDCRALLKVQTDITGTKPSGDWNVLRRQLADCQALRLLSRAAAPSRTALPVDLKAARDTRLWPASIWPAVSPDEIEALASPGLKLRKVSGRGSWQLGAAPSSSLEIESQAYKVQIQLLAHADFNEDGWEDWLLFWQAEAKTGSWRSFRCLLLTRHMPGNAFDVLEAETVQ